MHVYIRTATGRTYGTHIIFIILIYKARDNDIIFFKVMDMDMSKRIIWRYTLIDIRRITW